MLCYFFFFKQKTAYEMRISDWSSDVCSSDLIGCDRDGKVGLPRPRAADKHDIAPGWQEGAIMKGPDHLLIDRSAVDAEPLQILPHGQPGRRHAIRDRGCIPVGRFRAAQDGQAKSGKATGRRRGCK